MVYFPKSFNEDLAAALNSNNPEQAAVCIRGNAVNRIALEVWFGETYDALLWVEQNLDLSLKILHIISQELTPEEFVKVEGIFKIFQTRFALVNEKEKAVSESRKSCYKTLFEKLRNRQANDPQKFKDFFLSRDCKQWNPLHYAAKEGNLALFSFLSEQDPELFALAVRFRTPEGHNPLFLAWMHKSMDIIRLVSERHKKCFEYFLEERFGPSKMTPLVYAASKGLTELCNYVSRHHAEFFVRGVQEKDRGCMTFLHWAAYKGHNDIIYILCRIDPEVFLKLLHQRDAKSLSPLHYALQGGNEELFEVVLRSYPKKYSEFIKLKEPELFEKICTPEPEKGIPLLQVLAAGGKSEILEIIADKEPDTFLSFMQKSDIKGLTPLQYASVHAHKQVFTGLYKKNPDLLQKLLNLKFFNWLLPDGLNFVDKILPFSNDPLLKSIVGLAVTLLQDNDIQSVQAIRTEMAKFPPEVFLPAILECTIIRSYLGRKDEIFMPALESLPSLNFLSQESRIELLLHLPPSKILETVEEAQEKDYRECLKEVLFVDGENYTVEEILGYAHHQFAPHMDEENAFNCVHDYLGRIKPKALALAMRNDEMREILVDFLKAIPDPHYRVIIPLVSCDEFMDFINSLHFVEQVRYCDAATVDQKKTYVESLPDLVPRQVGEWKSKVSEMCARLEDKLKEEQRDAPLLKKEYNDLKEFWSKGQDKLIPIAQNALVLNQLKDRLALHESSDQLFLAITEKIELSLIEFDCLRNEIERLRLKINRDFEEDTDLKEPKAPLEFFCPISGGIMDDPVKDKYGHVYEKAAIMAWLVSHQSSPLTRQPLTAADLTPNLELKKRIEEFFMKAK